MSPPSMWTTRSVASSTTTRASTRLPNLKRTGVYRVNVSVSRDTYQRQTSGGDASAVGYTVLDKVIPHPVYGPQSWLSVLNPGPVTEGTVKDLLAEAHDRARDRYEKRSMRRSK